MSDQINQTFDLYPGAIPTSFILPTVRIWVNTILYQRLDLTSTLDLTINEKLQVSYVNIESNDNENKIYGLLEEIKQFKSRMEKDKVQLLIVVDIFKEDKSSKWLGRWSKTKQIKEQWRLKINILGEKDSGMNTNTVRETIRASQSDIAKQSMKHSQRLSEEIGDAFSFSFKFVDRI